MDKTTFTQKVLESEQTLYRVAMSMLQNDADCEDAVQETILMAYKKLNTLRNEEYFKTWLVRILINNCKKIIKKKSRFVPIEELAEQSTLDDTQCSEVRLALDKLQPKIRAVMVMKYIEGFSVKEIKSILKIPDGTVKSRLARGRELLGLELDK